MGVHRINIEYMVDVLSLAELEQFVVLTRKTRSPDILFAACEIVLASLLLMSI